MEDSVEQLNKQPSQELVYFQKMQVQKHYIDQLLHELQLEKDHSRHLQRKKAKLGKTYGKEQIRQLFLQFSKEHIKGLDRVRIVNAWVDNNIT